MNARALVLLAMKEGRAEQGRVVVLDLGDSLTVLRTTGHVACGVNGLTTTQAVRLVDLFSASTEATDVLVRQWLASEQAGLDHHPHNGVLHG